MRKEFKVGDWVRWLHTDWLLLVVGITEKELHCFEYAVETNTVRKWTMKKEWMEVVR